MGRGTALFLYLNGEQVSKLWLGRALRDIRSRHGLSQTQLGQRVGLSRTSILNIESGGKYPSREKFDAICRALEITEEQVLDKVAEMQGVLRRLDCGYIQILSWS
jgi:transcriptional regulator with XRE-family HTH domain